jgi:hypothetical protein
MLFKTASIIVARAFARDFITEDLTVIPLENNFNLLSYDFDFTMEGQYGDKREFNVDVFPE